MHPLRIHHVAAHLITFHYDDVTLTPHLPFVRLMILSTGVITLISPNKHKSCKISYLPVPTNPMSMIDSMGSHDLESRFHNIPHYDAVLDPNTPSYDPPTITPKKPHWMPSNVFNWPYILVALLRTSIDGVV